MKKLTKAQQEIVDEMREGAELRSYADRNGMHKHHLGNQRKKKWRDIHANIVSGLVERGVIKILDPDITYRREYVLTPEFAPPEKPEDGVQDAVVVDAPKTDEQQ